ncbi:MAG: NUDIX domain-containing protein [Nanoarchaeota archaeon]
MHRWYDVVDREDKVTGKATWHELHAKGMIHRTVHILIFNSQGELLLQRRSQMMTIQPGKLTSSAAGHVMGDESYEHAAAREMKEELGINVALKPIGQTRSYTPQEKQNIMAFRANSDGPFITNEAETDDILFFNIACLEDQLKTRPEMFGDGFKAAYLLLNKKL